MSGARPSGEAAVVIGMLTFRRPADLRRALPAFRSEADTVDQPVRLLVVDNDPDGSARDFVAGLADPLISYVHEPRPGIAAGRNRALAEGRDAQILVFVDDDEDPRPGWLRALLDTWDRTGAAAVAGAVVSEFDVPLAPWLLAGQFFDRRRLPTGTRIDVAATNNLLLDLDQLPAGLTFDEEFSLSGGSDTLFTRSLHRAGRLLVWCDEAVVVDHVPVDRVTRRWVLARARRSGNSAVRVSVALAGSTPQRLAARGAGLARGAVRVIGGAGRVVLGAVTGSAAHDAHGRRAVARGLGMVGAATGRVVVEYARG